MQVCNYYDADFAVDFMREVSTMGIFGPGLRVRSKIWLELNGEPVFGPGREELLRLIKETGSISSAAKSMGMPYRKAWTFIDSMEKRLGFPLVNRLKGGRGGGESSLTPRAMEILDVFNALSQGTQEVIDEKFKSLFL